jgi:hypothetical protein
MMTFRVSPDGGEPYQVTAYARDVLMWEKAGKGRAFGDMAEHTKIGDLYGLAYFASRRQGLYTGSLSEFEQDVDVNPVDQDEDEADPDPTPAAPSAASSSNSPSPPASPRRSGPKRDTGRS